MDSYVLSVSVGYVRQFFFFHYLSRILFIVFFTTITPIIRSYRRKTEKRSGDGDGVSTIVHHQFNVLFESKAIESSEAERSCKRPGKQDFKVVIKNTLNFFYTSTHFMSI